MKNNYEIQGNDTLIFMDYHGLKIITIIDTEDLSIAKSFEGKWYPYYNKKTKSYYTYGCSKCSLVQLHRLVMGNPVGLIIDHVNHDTLLNKKHNLRRVTNAENMQNLVRAYSNSKSGILGVTWNKQRNKWECQIVIAGKHLYRALFNELEDAKCAMESARKDLLPYSS